MSPLPIQQVATFSGEPFGRRSGAGAHTGPSLTAAPLQQLCRQPNEPLIAVRTPEDDDIGLSFVTSSGTHPGAGYGMPPAGIAFKRLRPGTRKIDLRLNRADPDGQA